MDNVDCPSGIEDNRKYLSKLILCFKSTLFYNLSIDNVIYIDL